MKHAINLWYLIEAQVLSPISRWCRSTRIRLLCGLALMTGTDWNESSCVLGHLMSQWHLQPGLPLQPQMGCMPQTHSHTHTQSVSQHRLSSSILFACVARHFSTTPEHRLSLSLSRTLSLHPRSIRKCGAFFKCCVASVCLNVCVSCLGYWPPCSSSITIIIIPNLMIISSL